MVRVTPMIGWIPASASLSENSSAPNRLLVSVNPTAGKLLAAASLASLPMGSAPIGRLAKLAAANNFPAVGLTDTNNLFGALEFSDKLAEAGIPVSYTHLRAH